MTFLLACAKLNQKDSFVLEETGNMKVFFQSMGVLFAFNVSLTSRLALYRDVEIIVGTPEPLLYLYGNYFSRCNNNRKIIMIQPPRLPYTQKVNSLITNIIARSSFLKNFLSNFDILHLNEPEHPYTKVMIDIKKPKILSLHSLLSESSERKCMWKMDAVIACSNFLSELVYEKSGYKPKVIYHGVDTTLFNTLIPKINARKHLGLPTSKKIVLWNARLIPEKDLKTLIDAIPIVAKEIPDTLFIIKGRTKRARYSYILRYAHEHLKSTGTDQNALFMLGYEFLSKMPYYYRSADVFVHTSLFESFGLVYAEAMACAVPIVAANTTTAPEIVGDAGLLFEPKNPDDLAEKIVRLLCNEKIRIALCNKGLNRLSKLGLTWENAAKSYRDLYFSLG